MASVGIRELRQRASELLRRVAAGETIEVTDRGRPVALLSQLPQEGSRALLPIGAAAVLRGEDVLSRLELIRINDRILAAAGSLLPEDVRTLDAIHLATAQQLATDLAGLVTYDERMSGAAEGLGWSVVAPS